MNIELFLEVLKNSFLITGLVIIMMLMIEFLNVKSHGKIFEKLKCSSVKQVVTAACLGLIPGCVGGFAVVSLYTHKLLSFGALIAMMICSSGDEAFVMLAMIPETALIMFGVLFVIAIISGVVVDKVMQKKKKSDGKFSCKEQYVIHEEEHYKFPSIFKLSSYKTLKNASKERIILMVGILTFAGAIFSGLLEHSHNHEAPVKIENSTCAHDHSDEHSHITDTHDEHSHEEHSHEIVAHEEHSHEIKFGGINILNERWLNILFGIFSIITLLLISVSNDHFVKEHLWNHVVKSHFKSVFLWTFGALLLLQIMIHNLNMESLIQDNMILMIILAVLIGIIPESGPHLFFITLFAGGVIPFSVLLANSIVQDGHTTIPLLAESKSTFIKAKLINVVVGLIVGIGVNLMGF